MRGHHQIPFEWRRAPFAEHGINGRNAAHDADLVQVGINARGAVRQDDLGKAHGAEVAALRMDVALDEAGGEVLPAGVQNLGLFADGIVDITDGGDALAGDGDAAGIDLAAIDVDNLTIDDRQIGFFLSARYCQ